MPNIEKNMKRVLLLLSFLSAFFSHLFPQNDHLQPEYPGKYGYAFYDSIIGIYFNEPFDIRFIAAPSWGHISAFSLENENRRYLLKTCTIPYTGQDTRKTGFCCIELEATYYRSLKVLIKTALKHVDFTEEDNTVLDGIRYYFSAPNERNNLKIGVTHSPKDSSLMQRLSLLCDTISMAQDVVELPEIKHLNNLTQEIKRYAEQYALYHKQYKSRGLYNLTPEYYKNKADTPPCFKQCNNLTEHAVQQIQYPDSLLRTDTWGEAICLALIDSAGTMHFLNCTASHPLFYQEACRIVKGMREWEPAIKNGKAVNCDIVIFIPFNPERYRKQLYKK